MALNRRKRGSNLPALEVVGKEEVRGTGIQGHCQFEADILDPKIQPGTRNLALSVSNSKRGGSKSGGTQKDAKERKRICECSVA